MNIVVEKLVKKLCTRFLKQCTRVTRKRFNKARQIALNLVKARERRCRSLWDASKYARLYPALKSEIGDLELLCKSTSQFPLFLCFLRMRFWIIKTRAETKQNRKNISAISDILLSLYVWFRPCVFPNSQPGGWNVFATRSGSYRATRVVAMSLDGSVGLLCRDLIQRATFPWQCGHSNM